MNKNCKNMLPDWWKDNTDKKLILSNDIDSLLSVKLLEQVKPEYKLKYFYDFEDGLFRTGETGDKTADTIGVDIAFDKKIKTFDNHVTSDNGKFLNPNSINLNNVCGLTSSNYSKKYCCSTALLIYSLFDIPLPKSEIGKAILLAIDSTYYSYYNAINRNRSDWLAVHKKWLSQVLEFPELLELEENHTQEDFDKFSFVNKAKIQVIDDWDDGTYTMYFPLERRHEIERELDISLDIPNVDFKRIGEVKAKSAYLDGRHKSFFMNKFNVLSFAMTGANHANYSILLPKDH